jgi:hypothetical protein
VTENLTEKNPAAVALGRLGGLAVSPAKAAAARVNACLGGWPKGRPRKTAPVPVPLAVGGRREQRRWERSLAARGGAGYQAWRNLQAVRAAGCCWGATYPDAILAALKLRDLDLLDATLDLWPQIRSNRLRSWAADVMTAARWLQVHPLDTPTPDRIWPEVFGRPSKR